MHSVTRRHSPNARGQSPNARSQPSSDRQPARPTREPRTPSSSRPNSTRQTPDRRSQSPVDIHLIGQGNATGVRQLQNQVIAVTHGKERSLTIRLINNPDASRLPPQIDAESTIEWQTRQTHQDVSSVGQHCKHVQHRRGDKQIDKLIDKLRGNRLVDLVCKQVLLSLPQIELQKGDQFHLSLTEVMPTQVMAVNTVKVNTTL